MSKTADRGENKINVLCLINSFTDSSISEIIFELIKNIGTKELNWHIAGMSEQEYVTQGFSHLGAQVFDFSNKRLNNFWTQIREIRNYVISHDINIVHSHTPRTIYLAALALVGLTGVRHVATKHLFVKSNDRNWGLKYALQDRVGLYLPDTLVAVSNVMRDQISRYPGLGNKVKAIRNAIPCDLYYQPEYREAAREALGIPSGAPMLGYVGRIQKVKRIDILLSAFSSVLLSYPDARLVLVGEGDLRSKLESYAAQLGISNAVIWTGFRKDVPHILAAMDIYIQPSSNEGLSLSILEAMAAQKAIVATSVGGASELIQNGKTGFLVPPNSASKLAKQILLLLEQSDVRTQIANGARETAISEFKAARMSGEYLQVYKDLMNRTFSN